MAPQRLVPAPGGDGVPDRDDGAVADAVAPVIVSASRATDVPALYGDWLLRRLRAGWCEWVNPFNRQRRRVSFERTRAIVLWSKNPAPLLPRLDELDALGFGYYFTFTLNDYEREGLEPGIPPLAERIETFCSLSRRLGPERVVWRFDPILAGGRLSPKELLRRIACIGDALHGQTRKLVVSFADVSRYPAARGRLEPGGFREPAPAEVERIAAGLAGLGRGWGLEVATCAEKADLSRHGIGHNRCVDDRLLARAFPHDQRLLEFLGGGAGPGAGADGGIAHPLKDRGQRPACGCVVSKDIGRYGTCTLGCAYCYATASPAAAAAAHARHDPEAPSL